MQSVIYLAVKIYRFLAVNAAHMSDKTRNLHRQIVKVNYLFIIKFLTSFISGPSHFCYIAGIRSVVRDVSYFRLAKKCKLRK